MKALKNMNDTEIKVNGINALNKTLGPSGAFKFLTLLNRDITDSVKISRELYKNQSIDAIFTRAKKSWK
ncbi:MAG: hypothetical protein ABIA63_10085 [bacterium]